MSILASATWADCFQNRLLHIAVDGPVRWGSGNKDVRLTHGWLSIDYSLVDRGHAAFADGGDLFITNLATGMDVYSFPPTPLPKRSVNFYISQNYPLIVSVSPKANFAVVGGEDGHARVYDPHRGVIDGLLPHGNRKFTSLHHGASPNPMAICRRLLDSAGGCE